MSIYTVHISVMITPKRNADGSGYDHGDLMFSRRFAIEGRSFTDLAPKVDAVYDAIASFADVAEQP